jgi:hypothetical protein
MRLHEHEHDLDDDEWTPGPGECTACGIELGTGRGMCRPAIGTTRCLECATLYDPPTAPDASDDDLTP